MSDSRLRGRPLVGKTHLALPGTLAVALLLVACGANDVPQGTRTKVAAVVSGAARCQAIAADSVRHLRDAFRLVGNVEGTWVQLFDGPPADTEIVVTYYRPLEQSHQTFTFEGGRLLCARVDNARFDAPGSQTVTERNYRHVTYRDTAVELLDGAGGDTTELRADALRALAHTLLARADTLRRAALAHRPPRA